MAVKRTIPTRKVPRKNGRRPSKLSWIAFRRGRTTGWRDVLHAYLRMDTEGFQDWLYTLTGHNE